MDVVKVQAENIRAQAKADVNVMKAQAEGIENQAKADIEKPRSTRQTF